MTRRRPHDESDDAEKHAREELVGLYQEVERRMAGHSCPGTTECCRFGVTGREPYVTSVELALIDRAVARAGGRTPASARGASKLRAAPALAERRCPLLTDAGRCSVYESRPLGCRTFYCDRKQTDHPLSQEELNAFVRRLKEIAERHSPGGERGRPLTRAHPPG